MMLGRNCCRGSNPEQASRLQKKTIEFVPHRGGLRRSCWVCEQLRSRSHPDRENQPCSRTPNNSASPQGHEELLLSDHEGFLPQHQLNCVSWLGNRCAVARRNQLSVRFFRPEKELS